eukprot:jgi/Botrbrau1/14788/Bobra.105_1s0003.2
MPQTNNSTLLTCARDGQVRMSSLAEGGSLLESKMLYRHMGSSNKLALEPENPSCFYSCGADGQVCHYDLRCARPHSPQLRILVCKCGSGGRFDNQLQPLDLHSIDINPMRPHQFLVAGGEGWLRVYDHRRVEGISALSQPVATLCPGRLRQGNQCYAHLSITCAKYSYRGEILASYADEDIYLFSPDWDPLCRASPVTGADPVRGAGSPPHLPAASSRKRRAPHPLDAEGEHPDGVSPRRPQDTLDLSPSSSSGPMPSWSAHTAPRSTTRRQEAAEAAPVAAGPPPPPAAALAAPHRPTGEGQDGISAQCEDSVPPGQSPPQPRSPRSTPAASPPQASGGALASVEPHPAVPAGAGSEDPLPARHTDGGGLAGPSSPLGDRPAPASLAPPGGGGASPAARESLLRRMGWDGDGWDGQTAPEDDEDLMDDDQEWEVEDIMGEPEPHVRRALDMDLGSESSVLLRRGASGSELRIRLSMDQLWMAVQAVSEVHRQRDTDYARDLHAQGAILSVAPDNLRTGLRRHRDNCPAGRARKGPDADGAGRGEGQGGRSRDHVLRRFSGHRNSRTVKGVNFMGPRDDFVVTGSDCGNIFIWCKTSGRLLRVMHGDNDVVNCLEPHPDTLLLATSGIEDDVKLWAPTSEFPRVPGPEVERLMADNRHESEMQQQEHEHSFHRFIDQLHRSASHARARAFLNRRGDARGGSAGGPVAPDRDRDDRSEEMDSDEYEEDDTDGRDACSIS